MTHLLSRTSYLLLLSTVVAGLVITSFPVLATTLQDGLNSAGSASNLPNFNAKEIIDNVIKFVLSLIGVLALAGIIWGGFQYILAFADEGRAQKGKEMIKWSIIGLIIVGLAAVVVNTILSIF